MNKEVRSKINYCQIDDAPSTIQQDHHELFAVSMHNFLLNKNNKKKGKGLLRFPLKWYIHFSVTELTLFGACLAF